jgi:threonine aldolase
MAERAEPVNLRSDNVAGVAPEIMAALVAANHGTDASYGADRTTAALRDQFSDLFETSCFVQPVATGTAANALALALLSPPYGAIYCSGTGHIDDSECGAGEFFTGGAKIVKLGHDQGRLPVASLEAALAAAGAGNTSRVQPAVLSLTQATERGTVYSLAELRALIEMARRHGLRVHMDGARFANALVQLGCSPAEMTWKLGIDVLSFGATKNGTMLAEAIVVFDETLIDPLRFRARRAGQGFSKMRFMSVQLEAYIKEGLWLGLAGDANAMARRLAEGLGAIAGVEILYPVQINEIFARLSQGLIDGLVADGFGLYDRGAGEVRMVTAFNTTAGQIDALLAAARHHASAAGA